MLARQLNRLQVDLTICSKPMMFSALALAAVFQAAPSGWLVQDNTSALDGRRSYVAGVVAAEPIVNSAGLPDKPMLAVGCVNNRRVVILQWPRFLGRDEAQVSWKIGAGAVRTDAFLLMGPTSAQISGRVADRFLTQMQGEGSAVVRVTGYQNQQETSFDLTGARDVLATVDQACPARR